MNQMKQLAMILCMLLLISTTRLLQANNDNITIYKTFQNIYGDVIDCIHIYQQLAFEHPLLKNHVIPPSLYMARSTSKMIPNQSEMCPTGTIPKLRLKHNSQHNIPIKKTDDNNVPDYRNHVHAVVYEYKKKYHAIHGRFNVWNPKTFGNDFSLSQLWLVKNTVDGIAVDKSLEAGWMVYPDRHYGSSLTRIFIYWTNNGYKPGSGCYDQVCPGFVSTSSWLYVGIPLDPISTYNGKQWETEFTIYKNKTNNNWMFQVRQELVGYWPWEVLGDIDGGSFDLVEFGGEVFNSNPVGRPTMTDMGSGHFSGGGFNRACFIRDMWVKNDAGVKISDLKLGQKIESPDCYDGKMIGDHFYFGGPGYGIGKCT